MRFLGLTSSSSSINGRFKLSVSFEVFKADSFDELFTVSAVSLEPLDSLDSVSLELPADVLSAGALVVVLVDD